MNICVVAATMEEIRPFIDRHGLQESNSVKLDKHKVEYLITGTGITAMTYYLLHHVIFRRSDFYILAGIGGALNKDIEIGEIVEVSEDCFADLGAETLKGQFLNLDDMGLNTEPGLQWFSNNPYKSELQKVHAATIHQIPGRPERIQTLLEHSKADIISMEGAAFHYVMAKKDIPSLHIRAISHYVDDSEKESWNLPLAMQKLNAYLRQLIKERDLRKTRRRQ